MTEKKLPQRRCAGCGERGNKSDFVRIVREPDGNVTLDLTGKKNGRGVYICPKKKCLEKARRARRPEKSLETAVPDEVYERMLTEIGDGE